MQGTNVLFGQIAVVFGIVIAGVWSATQWTAAALGYQLRLGSPWFDFLGTPVYHPWRLFEWWFFFDAYAPHVFDVGGAIAAGSGLIAVLVAVDAGRVQVRDGSGAPHELGAGQMLRLAPGQTAAVQTVAAVAAW